MDESNIEYLNYALIRRKSKEELRQYVESLLSRGKEIVNSEDEIMILLNEKADNTEKIIEDLMQSIIYPNKTKIELPKPEDPVEKYSMLEANYGIRRPKLTYRAEYISYVPRMPVGVDRILIGRTQNDCEQPMSVDKYLKIRERLESVVRGIDHHMYEDQKFKIVTERLAGMLEYDYDAVYGDIRYQDENEYKSRNLENGVLKGKCVCAGFAEILRQTLSLVDIKSDYIGSKSGIDKNDGQWASHAFNLVKLKTLRGKKAKWYYTDFTESSWYLRQGLQPPKDLSIAEDFNVYKDPFHTPEYLIDKRHRNKIYVHNDGHMKRQRKKYSRLNYAEESLQVHKDYEKGAVNYIQDAKAKIRKIRKNIINKIKEFFINIKNKKEKRLPSAEENRNTSNNTTFRERRELFEARNRVYNINSNVNNKGQNRNTRDRNSNER